MSPSSLSLLSLLLLLLNGTVQSNDCSTEGFMELSLLEDKTGSTNNNGPSTAGLAESVETRWIITEEDKKFIGGCDFELTEVLVGVDIRTETDNRNQYPRIEIWRERGNFYRDPVSVELRLSPQNFTANGLYRYTLPFPLKIEAGYDDYRLGVYQPPDDRSVVRFYKVTGTGQIGRAEDYTNNDRKVRKKEITLQNSSILIHPITSNNCNYPPINESSFNTNSLSVTNVIPVNDTRAFPDIQFTCNGIITNWIIGITQNQTKSKHYPNIYLKHSSELIHVLTVDASAATSSNGNVHNFTSDIEVQYGDILVINVTTNSNPMYYQQYNGPLNYQLDSSNGLIPLEHNDYPLMSVVVEPSPSILEMSSTLTSTYTQSLTTNSHIQALMTSFLTLLTSISINNTLHITNTHSQSSNTLPSTLPVTSPTPSISDGTVSPPPPIVSTISSTSITDSSTSNPSVTLSTEGTLQSTGSNTLSAVLSTVFILLVVTILVILIVGALVYRRRLYKTSNENETFSSDEKKADIHQQSDALRMNEGQNPAYGVTGEKSGISANPAYGIHNREGIESIDEQELVYDEPRTMMCIKSEDVHGNKE
ncbi:PREDICTED: uncharacterized protein LOC105312809 isoform X2 [Amphimedon queenslandica]|uniref:CUB domain-containing protein n=1 Tax=Amphimedon queenslandica TaxID=400682 RepID=A0AAN0J5F2_AMPQE|nr:PREDICTED: uncharacterized protein LOC105312809 isoform X2 [Amphimedon queenslandica]|eukprot:XP_019852239.1 PREDICTED: uncharacterized protein LOC105312809 isoform X2 [Amphimedon queenslandica]